MAIKTEHDGAKDSSRKGGFWGRRVEAKDTSRKKRRSNEKREIREQLVLWRSG